MLSLAGVQAYLRDSLRPHALGECVEERIVTELAGATQLSVLLEQLLCESSLLDDCASRSYTHANGFDKLVVLSSELPQYKLRLHLWWPRGDSDLFAEHIHNHRWSFASVVVQGSLDAWVYERSPMGEAVHEYRYYSPEGEAGFRMDAVGRSCLTPTHHIAMPAGTHYTLREDVLHRVTPVRGSLTATLFLQGPAVRPFTNVFSDRPIAHPVVTGSRPLAAIEFAARIRCYLAVLRTHPAVHDEH